MDVSPKPSCRRKCSHRRECSLIGGRPDRGVEADAPGAPRRGRQSAERKAALRAIDAGGEVGDAEDLGGRAKDGLGRGHAVDHAEDLELRLELIGNEVDGEVGLADGVFDRERSKGEPARGRGRRDQPRARRRFAGITSSSTT